jgi:hypothetical protein
MKRQSQHGQDANGGRGSFLASTASGNRDGEIPLGSTAQR